MKISWGQTLVIFLLIKLFSVMTYTRMPLENNSFSVYMVAVAISTAVQCLLVIPVIMLNSKYQDKSIIEIAALKGNFSKYFVAAIYFIVILCVGISFVSKIYKFVSSFVYNSSGLIILAVLVLVIAAIYAAFCGIQGIARGSAVIFVLFIAFYILQLLNSLKSIDMNNIAVSYDLKNGNLLDAILFDLYQSSELVLIPILMPYIKNARKGIYGYICAKLISAELILFLAVTVLGGFVSLCNYPVYSLSGHTIKSTVERLDAFYMLLWVLISFVTISLIILSLKDILTCSFKNIKCGGIICGAILFGLMIPVFMDVRSYQNVTESLVGVVPIVILVTLIPSIFIWTKGKSK